MIPEYSEAKEGAPETIGLVLSRGEAVELHRADGRVIFLEASNNDGIRFILMNAEQDMIGDGNGGEMPYNYYIKLNRGQGLGGKRNYTVRITDSAYATLLNKGRVSNTLEDAIIEVRLS